MRSERMSLQFVSASNLLLLFQAGADIQTGDERILLAYCRLKTHKYASSIFIVRNHLVADNTAFGLFFKQRATFITHQAFHIPMVLFIAQLQ